MSAAISLACARTAGVGLVGVGAADPHVHPGRGAGEQQAVRHVAGGVADERQRLSGQRAAVLAHGQQVGEGLAGVELVGQRVDDGYAGVGGHLLEPRLARGSATRWPTPGDRAPGRCRRSDSRTPIWASAPSMIIGKPPSSAMPEAKEAWVRRVGLSKRTATVCGPASGCSSNGSALSFRAQLEHAGLLVAASGRRRAGSGGSRSCRSSAYAASRMRRPGREEGVGLLVGEHQRRRQPDALGVGLLTMKPGVEGGREHLRRSAPRSGRDRSAGRFPRTSVTRSSAASPSRRRCADLGGVVEQAVLLDGVERRRGRPPPPPGCRRRWCRGCRAGAGRPPRPWRCRRRSGSRRPSPLATRHDVGRAVHRVGDGGVLVGEPGARCGRCRSGSRRARAGRRARG